MELSSGVLCGGENRWCIINNNSKPSLTPTLSLSMTRNKNINRTSFLRTTNNTDFYDKAHLHYYDDQPHRNRNFHILAASSKSLEKNKKKKKNKNKTCSDDGLSTKQKIKLLKSFAESDQLQEAAEVFLKRLEELRAEEKQQKRMRKEEKAKLKALMEESSSSSSSDSDGREVIDMSRLRSKLSHQPQPVATLAPIPCLPLPADEHVENENENVHVEAATTSTSSMSMNGCGKRVEVCMGNKCKKSGGAALLAEFERQINTNTVVACKCMGKCKSAPNVRVFNDSATTGDVSVRIPTTANPLYIGVGLEDVTSIVATFLGEDNNAFLQQPASP